MEELNDIIKVVQMHRASESLQPRFVGNVPSYEWTGIMTSSLVRSLEDIGWRYESFHCNNKKHPDFQMDCVSFVTMGIPLDAFEKQPISRKK